MTVKIETQDPNSDSLNNAELKNAATESTLRELLGAVRGNTSNLNSTSGALNGLNRNARNASDSLDDFAANTEEYARQQKQASRNLAEFSQRTAEIGFGAVERSLKRLGSRGLDVTDVLEGVGSVAGAGFGALGKGATALGKTLKGSKGTLGKLLGGLSIFTGVLSSIAGVALPALAGSVGAVIGIIDGVKEPFYRLSDSGFIVGSSFSNLIKNVLDSNMTIGQFSQVVANNREMLATFGGSVTVGANNLIKLRRSVADNERQFQALGIGMEELPEFLAAYQTSISVSGRQSSMTLNELSAGALEYAKRQKALSDLTGEELKSLQQKSFAQQTEVMVAGLISDLESSGLTGLGEQYGKLMADVGNQYGPIGQQYVREILQYGSAVSQETGIFAAQMPTAARLLNNFAENTKSGAILQQDVVKQMFQDQVSMGKTLRAERSNLLGIAPGLATGPIATVQQSMAESILNFSGRLNMSADQIEESFKNIQDQATSTDPLITSFGDLEAATQKLKTAQQEVAIKLATESGKTITGAIDTLATGIKDTAAPVLIKSIEVLAKTIDVVTGKISATEAVTGMTTGDKTIDNILAAGATGAAGYAGYKGYKGLKSMLGPRVTPPAPPGGGPGPGPGPGGGSRIPRIGKGGGALGGLFTGVTEYMDSGDLIKSLVVGAGGAIGGGLGTIGGGALGTLLGPAGTAIGGFAGGAAGSIAGGEIAENLYNWLIGEEQRSTETQTTVDAIKQLETRRAELEQEKLQVIQKIENIVGATAEAEKRIAIARELKPLEDKIRDIDRQIDAFKNTSESIQVDLAKLARTNPELYEKYLALSEQKAKEFYDKEMENPAFTNPDGTVDVQYQLDTKEEAKLEGQAAAIKLLKDELVKAGVASVSTPRPSTVGPTSNAAPEPAPVNVTVNNTLPDEYTPNTNVITRDDYINVASLIERLDNRIQQQQEQNQTLSEIEFPTIDSSIIDNSTTMPEMLSMLRKIADLSLKNNETIAQMVEAQKQNNNIVRNNSYTAAT